MADSSTPQSAFIDRLSESISTIPNTDVDGLAAKESADYDWRQKFEFKTEDLKTRQEYNLLLKQNRKERKKFAVRIFRLTCIWTTTIFLILIANGLKRINNREYFSFNLSDSVLITLITSTTINFFGFFLLVVRYLFHIEGENPSSINTTPNSTAT